MILGCSFIDTQTCIVESFDRNNCYEQNGEMFLEKYYHLSYTRRLGLVQCGHVLNCNTSLCHDDIIIGNEYYCRRWRRNSDFDTMTMNIIIDEYMFLLMIGCAASFVGITLIVSVILIAGFQHLKTSYTVTL